MRGRRARLGLGALALLVPACSDDDSSSTDGASGAELTVVEVDGRPSAATVALGDLWVTSDDEPSTRSLGGVRRYDAATGELVVFAAVGGDPVAVVPLRDGVWTVGATGVMTRAEPATNEHPAAEVDLGGALVDAVVAGGRLWVADIGRSLVHVLDPDTGEQVEDPVLVEAGAVRLAATPDHVWVTGLEDRVTSIDVSTTETGPPIRVGIGPIGMVVVDDELWVAISEEDMIVRVDVDEGEVVGDPIAVGDAPISLARDGDAVWVLNQDDATVQRIDATTGQTAGEPIAVPMLPRGMAVSEAGLWVVGVEPALVVLVPR